MTGTRSRKRRRRPGRRGTRRRRRVVLSLLAALTFALSWWALSLGGLDPHGPPAHDPGEGLRVMTWNLENFSGDPGHHDLDRMVEVIDDLDPDLLALQEVKDPAALARLLPGWEILSSKGGGRGHQHVALAWRPDRLSLEEGPVEHGELTMGGRVRPALSAYFRSSSRSSLGSSELDLWVTVVHLKAMPDGHALRTRQWPLLVQLTEAFAERDPDAIILGDFNTTGLPGATTADEHAELDRVLGAAGLRRMPNPGGCSAYWDGRRRDAWKEPSEIDLIWVRGLKRNLGVGAQVHSGTHCAAHRCENFRSTEAYPVADYESVSDHCPVILDLRHDAPSTD